MRTKTWIPGLLLAAAMMIHSSGGTATAAALNPATIPATSSWVIYCNIDAVTQHPEIVQLFLDRHPAAQKKIAQLEQTLGIKFPEDFHDVVLTGHGAGPRHGVAIIHVDASQDRVDQFLQNNPANTIVQDGGVAVRAIKAPRHTIYEAPAANDLFVVARSKKMLLREVHVIRGQAAAIEANSPLLAGGQPDLMLYVAGDKLQRAAAFALHRKHHGLGRAWMRHVVSGWLACGIRQAQVVISGQLIADSAQAADQMVQGAKGLQAMMELGETGAHASPRQQLLAAMMGRLQFSTQSETIQIHWSMPLAKLEAAAPDQGAAGSQP